MENKVCQVGVFVCVHDDVQCSAINGRQVQPPSWHNGVNQCSAQHSLSPIELSLREQIGKIF